jgi:hypothetical protein
VQSQRIFFSIISLSNSLFLNEKLTIFMREEGLLKLSQLDVDIQFMGSLCELQIAVTI